LHRGKESERKLSVENAKQHISQGSIKGAFLLNGMGDVTEASVQRTTSDVSSLLENLQELWEIDLTDVCPLPVFRLTKQNE
jgi:hypothetical protein